MSGYFSGLFACVIFDFLHLDRVSLYSKRTGFQFPEMLLPTPPPQSRNHRLVSPRGNPFAVLKM